MTRSDISILVVEDDPAIAIDIALNLESAGYTVFGPTHSADRALQYLDNERIDLAILDINIAGEQTGMDIAEIINRSYGIPFIYLTSYSDNDTVHKAAKTYPASFIVKPFKEEDLAPAIEIALAKAREEPGVPGLDIINSKLVKPITPTEHEIIGDMLEGLSNKQIADKRFNSPHTIKSHVKSIYSKLQVHNKMELQQHLLRLLRNKP